MGIFCSFILVSDMKAQTDPRPQLAQAVPD